MDRIRCDASGSKMDWSFRGPPIRCDAARKNRFANPFHRKSKGEIGRCDAACSKNGQDLLAKRLPHASRKKNASVISPNPSRRSRNLGAILTNSQNAISTNGEKKDFRDVPANSKRYFPRALEADQRDDLLVVGRVEDHREEPRP